MSEPELSLTSTVIYSTRKDYFDIMTVCMPQVSAFSAGVGSVVLRLE
jgi:hypothetical protein